jgi:hypothetical protein
MKESGSTPHIKGFKMELSWIADGVAAIST